MPKKLRLLTIAHSYVVALNRRLPAEIARLGDWDVTAVSPEFYKGGNDLRSIPVESQTDLSYRFETVPTRCNTRIHTFFYGRQLQSLMREPYDLIHCWEEPYILAGAQIAWNTRREVPLVCVTAQNLMKRYLPPFSWFERYCLQRAAGWIPFGKTIADTMLQRPGYRNRPHRIIPMGVDIEHFRPDPELRLRTRQSLGWTDDGPPVIGYLGRFVPEKGVKVLTQSLDRVSTPWRFLLVGGGPLEPWLRSWASQHGDRVRIQTGVVHNDVPQFLNAMDALCAPSLSTARWREQFGRMLVEGFACGVPVLGSDSGEIPYVIGDAGLVAPEGNVEAWASKIAELLENPTLRAELSARGLVKAREKFSFATIARQHADFFRDLIEISAKNK